MSRVHRMIVAVLIGLLSGILCFNYQVRFSDTGGDLGWVLRSAPALLAGANPYHATAHDWPLRYPLVTLFALLPFAWLPLDVAAGLFFGLSSGALAYGLTRTGPWRLLVFLAFPYWGALQVAQWSPLIGVAYLYPALLPLTMLKPSIGLPVALTTRPTWRDIAIVGAALALSFAVLPTWPLDMAAQLATHPNVIPLLTAPGLVLAAMAALRWRAFRRSREGWFVLLLACIPQTLFYDTLLLGLTLGTPRVLLAFAALTWAAYLGWYIAPWLGAAWVVSLVYLPTMALVLWPAASRAGNAWPGPADQTSAPHSSEP